MSLPSVGHGPGLGLKLYGKGAQLQQCCDVNVAELTKGKITPCKHKQKDQSVV